MRTVITLIILLTFIDNANGQKKYVWRELLKTMSIDTTRLHITEKDSLIIHDEGRAFDWEKQEKINVNRYLIIENPKVRFLFPEWLPTSQKLTPTFDLYNFNFVKPVEIEFLGKISIMVEKCTFQNGTYFNFLDGGGDANVFFLRNVFNGQYKIQVNKYNRLYVTENEFIGNAIRLPFRSIAAFTENVSIEFYRRIADSVKIYKNEIVDIADMLDISSSETDISMYRNKFEYSGVSEITMSVDKANSVAIIGNKFGTNLILSGDINGSFDLYDNYFSKLISFGNLFIPARSNIAWESIRDKVAILGDTTIKYNHISNRFYEGGEKFEKNFSLDSSFAANVRLKYLYNGYTDESLLNKKLYKKLIEVYKSLYDNAKSKGDLESSNGYFVAVKDLEGDRLAAIYNTNGRFKDYFSWKLNRLMKFYTNHATEPALALVVSVYIILGFAVFYFFFPSEWDTESKGKLIQHYRDFVQKNEKGYVKPFLKMLWGFIISFLNAITLSLNSFVTLGFGNIPTKGIARYVCIIQGFIGWFLLSIFTVALFNQVLF